MFKLPSFACMRQILLVASLYCSVGAPCLKINLIAFAQISKFKHTLINCRREYKTQHLHRRINIIGRKRSLFLLRKLTFEYKSILMYVTADESGVSTNYSDQVNNIVMYSSIKSLDANLSFKNFSIKYVISGDEIYRLKEQDYTLKGGDYLLCNKHCEGKVFIDSKTHVKGICIDIASEMVSEIVASLIAPDTNISDLTLDRYFNSQDFLEQQYTAKTTHLGSQLIHLDNMIQKNPYDNYQFDPEFYYRLSEGIVADYIPVVKQFQAIRSVKSETKKDLLRKLAKGKTFIELYYKMEIDIARVAEESNISQYHFFRLFRDVYGVSPYQFIKQKRMQAASEILLKQRLPLAQLAMEVGYSDIFSFSKAYKQYFGCPPSQSIII